MDHPLQPNILKIIGGRATGTGFVIDLVLCDIPLRLYEKRGYPFRRIRRNARTVLHKRFEPVFSGGGH
jgi:hypothetical protein